MHKKPRYKSIKEGPRYAQKEQARELKATPQEAR
jgi:hypothetical protein